MNVQSTILGALMALTAPMQPQPTATLGDQPYLVALKNPTTDTQVTFICHMIQEN